MEGKTKRQDQGSNSTIGIRNNLHQLGDRISTVEMVWAHRKIGGLDLPQNGLAS
jgi:hypothetical protein